MGATVVGEDRAHTVDLEPMTRHADGQRATALRLTS
jgi:hypothetical protein